MSRRIAWMVPAGLFVAAVLPLVPGYLRMAEIAGAPGVIPPNPRAMADPAPVVVHVVAASVFYFLGALQFSASIRRKRPDFHRRTGRLIVPFGIAVAVSGLWMTLFYPLPPGDNHLLTVFRGLASGGMLVSILLGVRAILLRDVPAHRVWMMRGYALGLGAATQIFVFLTLRPLGDLDPTSRALAMGLGWAINLAIAEWIIRRPARARADAPAGQGSLPQRARQET